MPEVIYKFDLPAFTGRNVPIKEIAAAIGKDAQYVKEETKRVMLTNIYLMSSIDTRLKKLSNKDLLRMLNM